MNQIYAETHNPFDSQVSIKPRALNKTISVLGLLLGDFLCISLYGVVINSLLPSVIEQAPYNIPQIVYSILTVCALAFFVAKGHYQKRTPFWDETADILKIALFFSLLQGTLIGMFTQSAPVLPSFLAWIFAGLSVVFSRSIIKSLLLKVKVWQIPTVIIGDGPNAIDTANALIEERLLGYEILAFVSPHDCPTKFLNIKGKKYPVRPLGNQPEKFLRRLGTPHVVVALERGGLNQLQHWFDLLTLKYPRLSVVPALKGLPLFGTEINHFFSHEVIILNVKSSLRRFTSRLAKRLFDLAAASTLLLLLSPIFLLLIIKIRQTGKTIIFGHERVGFGGRKFKCYKFRSMVENAQEKLDELLQSNPAAKAEWDREFKLKNDPRITPFGQFIRKTSLDELPQLINVLKGEMSLVGPRPVIQEEIERYGEKAAYYYRAKPGITGLWQVSGRNDIDYDSRIALDVWYVRNWSIWSDIVILLRTVSVVLSRSGAY